MKNKVFFDNKNQLYIFQCPQCEENIVVHCSELNCHIFRHGIYKHNYEQVNPHLDKENCDRLKNEDMVYGCCLPFKIIYENNELFAIVCDYI